jgi:iron complex transport system substrate-binding protein
MALPIFNTGTAMHNRHIKIIKLLSLLLTVATVALPASVLSFEITDDENQTVNFTAPFSRIISLYPAHTENLAYLGCDAELIGVGESDNFPEAISSKPQFSYRDNVEIFLAAKPDLILIRPMISRSQPELIEKLRASGITIISLQPTSITQIFSYWQKLGQLCGRTDAAELMAQQFQQTLAELKTNIPEQQSDRPLVYFEAIHNKMKTFAPTAISVFALTAGGGRNIADDAVGRNNSNIAPYGKERLLSHADSIDVFLSQTGRMNRVSVDEIYNEPGFQLIKAVQNKSVFLIEEELVSRPTMRLLTGISKIQSFLYPGLKPGLQRVVRHELSHKPQL